MNCYNCGQVLPEDSQFCQYCGNKIENEVVNQMEIKEEAIVIESPTVEIEKNKHRSIEKTKKKKLKLRFCKFCGAQIDTQTKKCSGCGKQYFKGIKFNKFLIIVFVLSLMIIASVTLNIVQVAEINRLKADYAVIVDSNSKRYHLYGCADLDTSSLLEIYNISKVKELGYSECSKCYNKSASQRALDKLKKKYGID